MLKRTLRGCVAALALLAAVGVGVLARGPCTVTVQPVESIQTAIDAAPEGAVICLAEGEWWENTIVTKSLTLRGQRPGRSVLCAAQPDTPAVKISSAEGAASVVLQSLMITGAQGSHGLGILVEGSARVTIDSCVISGNEGGIWLEGSVKAAIESSLISRNGMGIVLLQSAQAKIARSIIYGSNSDGIWLWGLVRATISDCIVARNDHGIVLWGVAQSTITNSVVSCNTYDGVVLRDSARVTADGNRIVANARYGVALHDNSCDAPEGPFTGHITGASNVVPGPGTAGGNKKGAVFPGGLEFLRTEDGGKLDRRD